MQRKLFQRIVAATTATLFLALPSTALADKEADLQGQLGTSQQKIKDTSNQLSAARAEQDALVQKLLETSKEIDRLNERLRTLEGDLASKAAAQAEAQNRLETIRQEIVKTQQELEAAKAELKRSKEVLNMRVTHLYKMGKVPFLAVLLNSKNFQDFLSRSYFIAEVAAQDAYLVRKVRATEAAIQTKQALQVEEKKAAEAKEAEIAREADLIAQIKAQQESHLASVQNEQAQKQAMADELKQQQASMLAFVQQEQAKSNSISDQIGQVRAEKARAAAEAKRRAELAAAAARRAAEERAAARSAVGNSSAAEPSQVATQSDIDQAIVEECARQGINPEPVLEIVSRESSGNPNAVNASSGAAGLFQRLPADSITLGDVPGQVQDGIAYIKVRYGTSEAALAWWDTFGWY